MSRRVLIVSPHFPPVNAPDMQRIRQALPYFVDHGWEVAVLTVNDPTPTAPQEPALLATIPATVRVARAHCFSRRWTGLLGFNNVALRSLPFLFLAGHRLLTSRRYDVVYFSTTMFITLPLGRVWRWWHGVPYVIDLQDPWVTDYYEQPGAPRPPGGWKYQIVTRLGRALEGWTLRGMAQLIVVSAAYIEAVRHRHPELSTIPATVLPFGSPDADLAHIRQTLPHRRPLLPAGTMRLAHAGAFGPGQLAVLGVLFRALAVARHEGIPVTVHLFGTSYDPAARPVTRALALQHGVHDYVQEQPGRIPYFDALQITLEAEADLLIGSNDLAFVPSKLLTVLAAGRPVLAIAPAGSAMATRLAALGQSCVCIGEAEHSHDTQAAIVAQLRALAKGQLSIPQIPVSQSARVAAELQLAILAAASN